jgi:thiol-disulfide isomerase/thioredoxin
MKHLNFFNVLAIVGVLIAGYAYYYYRIPPKLDVSNYQLYFLNQEKVDPKIWDEKVVLYSFYQSWCGPCIKEIKDFEELSKTYKNKLTIICISDEDTERQLAVANRFNQGELVFLQTKTPFKEIGIHTFPTNYIVNRKKQIIYQKTNPDEWLGEEMRAKIENWIN